MLAHSNKHSEVSKKGLMCYSGMSLGYKQLSKSLSEACQESTRSWCSSRERNVSVRSVAFIQSRSFRFQRTAEHSGYFIKRFGSANCISWAFFWTTVVTDPPSIHLPSTGCKHLQAYWLAAPTRPYLKTSTSQVTLVHLQTLSTQKSDCNRRTSVAILQTFVFFVICDTQFGSSVIEGFSQKN